MNNKQTLTTEELEKSYGVKARRILRWIKNGKINATKEGNEFLIDRQSFEAYLKERGIGFAIEERSTPKESENNETPTRQVQEKPGEQMVKGKPATQSDESGKQQTSADLRAGSQFPQIDRPSDKAATQTVANPEQTEKSSRLPRNKQVMREAKKRFKKGPVRYAKDVMRKLDILQLQDIRNWILKRIDDRTRTK